MNLFLDTDLTHSRTTAILTQYLRLLATLVVVGKNSGCDISAPIGGLCYDLLCYKNTNLTVVSSNVHQMIPTR